MRATWAYSIVVILTTSIVRAGDSGALSLNQRGAPTPSFTLLGDLPGGAFMSRATAVSADGTTVVGYSTSTALNPAGGDEAFRWKDGQMIGLGGSTFPPPSQRFSRATGVNGDGSRVVGDSRFFSLQEPFLWQNGVMQSAFIEESYAGEMSTNGNFAVTSTFGPGVRGYRVQFNGISHQVPILPGGDSTGSGVNVHGISSDGSTVIGRSHSAGNLIQAIRWKFGVGTTPIGFLPGCIDNEATAVSADGNLVIGRCWINGLPAQPFLWTPENGIQPFVGGLAADAMSDDGSIMVGGGWIWDTENGARPLMPLLTSWGVDLTGIFGLYATDISAAGDVIVGNAEHFDGRIQAFRLVIPEPAAALLLAPALLILRRRARRAASRVAQDAGHIVRSIGLASFVMMISAVNVQAGQPAPLSLVGPETSNEASFTLLGDLPGGEFMSRATAVSADGSTVVGYSTSTAVDPNGGHEAFRWKAGQMLGLGAPTQGPGKFSRATGVNWDGSRIVGDSRPLDLDRPFLWENGTLTGTFFEESVAGQMSDNGHFAVHSQYGPTIWSAIVVPSGGYFNIPMLTGGDPFQVGVRALGISSDGLAAFGKSSVAAGQERAIRWKLGEGSYPVPLLSGCTRNEITAISGNGNIAVGVCEADNLSPQVFRWTSGTGTLPFPSGIAAIAMSDDASIMISEDSIWDQANGTRSIQNYFDSLGFSIQWSSVARLVATDLTPNGRVMVGYLERTDGTTEAWRAVIPEPAAALLLAPALLILRRRARPVTV